MLKPRGFLRRGIAATAALLAVMLLMSAPLTAATPPRPQQEKPAKVKVEKPTKAKAPKVEKVRKPAPADSLLARKVRKPAKPKAAPRQKAPEKSLAEQRAEDGPWMKGTNWLSFRAGYAKAAEANAGDGLLGYGLAYQHMMKRQWGVGFSIQHDVLGHLANATEVSVPFTAEITRHFRWKTVVRPYVGMGGGYYFHKYYRTGGEYTGAPGAGYFLAGGFNLPTDDRHLLGLDARMSFFKGREGVMNPVFGPEKGSEVMWSIKLNWAIAY